MHDKAALRRHMRQRLTELTPSQRQAMSQDAIERLLKLPAIQGAPSVFCYVALPAEIETRPLLAQLLQRGCTVLVPRIIGEGHMQAQRITALADLEPGVFGIASPRDVADAHNPRDEELIPAVTIVPGLAFAATGQRLGRGKGFYDRFLARHPDTTAIGLAFDCQIVEAVPVEAHDVRLRAVVTPTRVYETLDDSMSQP